MFDRLKGTLLGGEQRSTSTYQCMDCRKSFESTAANREEATCPDCGGDRTRRIVGCRQERPF